VVQHPGHRTAIAVATLALVTIGVIAAAFARPAYAWEVSKSTNGIVIQRSSDDTQTVTIQYYTDPKPNLGWGSYSYASGYHTSSSSLTFDSQVRSIELPLGTYDGWCLVVTKYGSSTDEKHQLYLEPQRVVFDSPQTVSVSTLPSITGTVSVDGMSLETTAGLQVDPWSTAGLPEGWLPFLVTSLAFCLGFVFVRLAARRD